MLDELTNDELIEEDEEDEELEDFGREFDEDEEEVE